MPYRQASQEGERKRLYTFFGCPRKRLVGKTIPEPRKKGRGKGWKEKAALMVGRPRCRGQTEAYLRPHGNTRAQSGRQKTKIQTRVYRRARVNR